MFVPVNGLFGDDDDEIVLFFGSSTIQNYAYIGTVALTLAIAATTVADRAYTGTTALTLVIAGQTGSGAGSTSLVPIGTNSTSFTIQPFELVIG